MFVCVAKLLRRSNNSSPRLLCGGIAIGLLHSCKNSVAHYEPGGRFDVFRKSLAKVSPLHSRSHPLFGVFGISDTTPAICTCLNTCQRGGLQILLWWSFCTARAKPLPVTRMEQGG